VVIDPAVGLRQMRVLPARRYQPLPSKKVLGTQVWPGAFGEYVVVPEETVFHLPDNLTYAQGSLVEPLTIGVHVRQSQPGQSVAILQQLIGGMISGPVCRARKARLIIMPISTSTAWMPPRAPGRPSTVSAARPAFVEKVLAPPAAGSGRDPHRRRWASPGQHRHPDLRRRGRIVLVALL
jgi:L-iditol 2-dehydrogenase